MSTNLLDFFCKLSNTLTNEIKNSNNVKNLRLKWMVSEKNGKKRI